MTLIRRRFLPKHVVEEVQRQGSCHCGKAMPVRAPFPIVTAVYPRRARVFGMLGMDTIAGTQVFNA